jgi:GTPase Era involved in 16S rRNA processing
MTRSRVLPVSRIEAPRASWTSRSFAAHSSAASSSSDDDDGEGRNPTSTSSSPCFSPSPPPVPLSRQRTLRVAVLGVPNAGKSTLVNALTGAKVSAVSPKTNTTATPCLGAFTVGSAQVLLLDTPGAVSARQARGPAHARRIRAAWASSEGCDAALLVVDAARQALRPDGRVTALAAALASSARAAEARDAAERAAAELERTRARGGGGGLVEAAEARAAAAAAAAAVAAGAAARASGGFGASPPPGWRPPRETILVLNKVDAISSPGGSSGREEALSRVADSLVGAAATGGAAAADADDDDEEELLWPRGGEEEKEGRGGSESDEAPIRAAPRPSSPLPLPVVVFFDAIHALSATRAGSRAVRSLSADLASRARAGAPWPLLPTDVSDRPARVLAAEIVREKAFLRLRDELPYSVEVVERGWRERGAGDGRRSTRVRGGGGGGGGGGGRGKAGGVPGAAPFPPDELSDTSPPPPSDAVGPASSSSSSSSSSNEGAEAAENADLFIEFGNPGSIVAEYDLLVSREPVRRMVVGRGGSVIGEIGIAARKELEKLLDRKVHLYLTVRVAGRGGGGGGR